MKMEENEETSVISLRVNSEQKEAIIQFFNFNDWDLNEVNQEDADSNIEETEFEKTFRISQNENCEECQHCLCRPCITDENNRQMWWLSEPVRANERNRVLRKEKYKLFWTMLFHRGVFMDTRYKSRKTESLQADPRLRDVVCHRRDILPQCVLKLVRFWYPNRKNIPYMGHRWK